MVMHIRRNRMLALGIAIVSAALVAAPRALARVDSVEPLWHVVTPPDARYVAADDQGSVVTGFSGSVWSTDQIGASVWKTRATVGEEQVFAPSAIATGLVLVPVDKQRLVAIDRATGLERWQQRAADIMAVGASASGDQVGVVTRTGVELRRGADGAVLWVLEQSIPELLAAPLRVSVTASVVLVAWTDTVSHVRAFDRVSGQLAWQRDHDMWESTPAVTSRAVFVAENQRRSPDGKNTISKILRLDLATGAIEWERRVRGLFFPTFVGDVEGSTVAIVDVRGRVFALNAGTGRVRWRRATGARQFENEAHVAGDVVTFTTLGTGLVVLALRDGSPVVNESPGRSQPWSIIRGSAATGDQLYLLTHPNGSGEAEGVLIMLPTGPDGYAPGYDLDVQPDG